jgi:hypothetical protein
MLRCRQFFRLVGLELDGIGPGFLCRVYKALGLID